jgi:hypothetical protein
MPQRLPEELALFGDELVGANVGFTCGIGDGNDHSFARFAREFLLQIAAITDLVPRRSPIALAIFASGQFLSFHSQSSPLGATQALGKELFRYCLQC